MEQTVVRPLRDFIAVKRDPEYVSPLGIVVPQKIRQVQSKQQLGHRGTVVAVGPGKYNEKRKCVEPLEVKIGDRVSFGEILYPECEGLVVMKQDAVAFVYDAD